MSRITAITSAMLAIAMLVMPLRASAAPKTTFADESLNYEIVYHWGLIWKHAASATLSLTASGSHYNSRLATRTVSWADKIYRVRDTLSCQMLRDGLKPLRYVKATHEKKVHRPKHRQLHIHRHCNTGQMHRDSSRPRHRSDQPFCSRPCIRHGKRVLLPTYSRLRRNGKRWLYITDYLLGETQGKPQDYLHRPA